MEKILSYKCPSCGSTLIFDNKSQKMLCTSCDSKYDLETIQKYDDILNESSTNEDINFNQCQTNLNDFDDNEKEQMIIHTCPSCGADIITDSTTSSTECVYCGNKTIISENLSGIYKPNFIIPFKLDKEDAKNALKKFYKNKFLLPNDFVDENKIDKVTGVYVPFWLYDCDVHAKVTYESEIITTWSDSEYQYTKTDHYLNFREGNIGFRHVPVDGISKFDESLMDAIEPFDISESCDFNMAYLSGYQADKYDIDSEESKGRANIRITNSTFDTFRSTVCGFSSVIPKSSSIDIDHGKIEYALLPVWLLNSKYKDKTYSFAMNGQTGKLMGSLPISRAKYWGLVGGITGILTLIGNLLYWFLI